MTLKTALFIAALCNESGTPVPVDVTATLTAHGHIIHS